MFYIKKCILWLGLIFLVGCSSSNEITNVVYGTYVSTPEKEYPFSYRISFFYDNTLWLDCMSLDCMSEHTNGIYGTYDKYSVNEENMDVFTLNIDNQEIIINLDRDEMSFEFPIKYEESIYLVEFKKILNAPVVTED